MPSIGGGLPDMPDYQFLGLGPESSMVTGVDVKLWGNTLLISCLYGPFSDRRPYQLVFRDTRVITWYLHDTDLLEEGMTDLLGFILGEGKPASPP